MTKLFSLVLLSLLLHFPSLQAQKKESLKRSDGSELPTIHTKVRFTTLVVLPDGEEISDVVCGDKDYWVIEGKDSIVYIKPAREGALTNINIISKTKAVYSFLVQEISKSTNAKDKPDLKVVLGGDEVTKLRREKDNLEELLLRSERSLKEVTEKATAEERKKKEEITTPAPKKEVASNDVHPPEPKPVSEPEQATRPSAAVVPRAAVETRPAAETPPPVKKAVPAPEVSFRVVTVARTEGVIRKTGRFLGRLFKRVSEKLHVY